MSTPQKITIHVNIHPHSLQQRLIMEAFTIPDLLEVWVACGSKLGKTVAAAAAVSTTLPISPQSLFRWVAPIYRQSKIGFDYCKRMLPGEPHVKPNQSELKLSMPRIDSMIEFCNAMNPETLEGEATAGTILDEAAKMKEQAYHSVKTTTGVTAGLIMGISTPRGDNWFKDKCMEARQEMIDAKRQGRRPRKLYIHAPSTSNPTLSKEYLEDARKSYTDRLYRQYILAEFVGGGAVFTNLANCYYTEHMELGDKFQWYADGVDQMSVVIGVDWARQQDYTVFTASEPATKRVVGIWRMHGLPYPNQIQRLITFAESFKEVLTVWHDKTGVGVALDDMLREKTQLPYHGVTFTNESKSQMMVALILAFEEGSYHIPYIDTLSREMNTLEVNTTALGLAKYEAADSSTDDMIMSMALSHSAMLQHIDRSYEIVLF